MAQVYPLKRVANKAHTISIPETDSIIAASIQRTTSGAAALWDDANVTAITIGGGTAQTTTTIGKSGQNATFLGSVVINQNLTVSGTVTTINTTNMTIADQTLLIAANTATGIPAALAVERGSTGNDALVYWNESSTRWEVGLFDTTGGTTTPSGALSTLVNFRASSLSLAGTAITADAALTITATGASSDLTFSARSASITLNQSGNTTLNGGFTSTSIIGALNELYAASGTPGKLSNTYTNGNAGTLARGRAVYIKATTSTIDQAVASTDSITANFIGVVEPAGGIATTASGLITTEGVTNVGLIAGLTVNPGDELFLSTTAGLCTNVAPSAAGNVVLSVGFVKDATAYTGASGDLVSAQLIRGMKTVI